MKLLSKPNHLTFENEKELTDLTHFRIVPTERNWVGNHYVSKNNHESFFQELAATKREFDSIFNTIKHKIDVTIIVDVSVFYEKKQDEDNIIEFLEELDDFYHLNMNLAETEKLKKTYEKRLNRFLAQTEYFPYLLRWYFSNLKHPFSNGVIKSIEDSILAKANRIIAFTIKRADEGERKLENKIKRGNLGRHPHEYQKEYTKLMTKVQEEYEEEIRKVFQVFLQRSFKEPSLVYFAMYGIIKFLGEIETRRKQCDLNDLISQNMILYVEKAKEKIETYYLALGSVRTFDINKPILSAETHLVQFESYLHLLFRKTKKELGLPDSLYSIKANNDAEEQAKLNILKTIVEWASTRITQMIKLPDKKITWIHNVKNDFFRHMGLESVIILEQEKIMGPGEYELMIQAIAIMTGRMGIIFPIFDPNSWIGLNSRQCALMAYTICLYHDMMNQDNYIMAPTDDIDEKGNPIYELILKNVSNTDSSYKKGSKILKQVHSDSDDAPKKTEHWVSFHFRRLLEGKRASDEARATARKFGIKEIPPGFTFVSPFVRGNRDIDPSEAKISAVHVLTRTLDKINKYEEEAKAQ